MAAKKDKDKLINKYANKLYKGELPRLKERLKRENEDMFDSIIRWFTTSDDGDSTKKGRRLPPTTSQGKVVVNKFKRVCGCCPKKYDRDPDDFVIHHIDGDRTNTVVRNLLLVCNSCHKKIHTIARAKLKDYSVKQKRKQKR